MFKDIIRMAHHPVSTIRKNHALEHATLQVLAEKGTPSGRLFGYSDMNGFWVVGNVGTQALSDASQEALQRLQSGERKLAIHPNCGTNIATSGLVAAFAAWIAMAGTRKGFRSWLERFPVVVTFVTMALMLSQPLGLRVQETMTTDANVGAMKIAQVMRYEGRALPVHRISTYTQPQLGS
ncbi:MAG: hypothetical protein JEZ00_10640 [Anaerolineaceae bacterium]|nr:hypothetical protein [Anaerolineaceae bacterium]